MARAKNPRGVVNPPKPPASLRDVQGLTSVKDHNLRQFLQAVKENIESLFGVNQRTANPAIFNDYFNEQIDKINDNASVDLVFRTVTADADIALTDDVLLVDASNQDITITLPSLNGSKSDRYRVKRIDASSNTVTVKGKSTAKIDWESTETLKDQGSWIDVTSNGSRWLVFGRDGVTKDTEERIKESRFLQEEIRDQMRLMNLYLSAVVGEKLKLSELEEE